MVCVSGRVRGGAVEHAGTGWGGRVGGRLGGQGVRSIDDAVARRVDRNGDGEFSGTKADNFFYLTDVMFSVRAIVDGEGRLHTRLDYTPYGVAMHGFAADVNGFGATIEFGAGYDFDRLNWYGQVTVSASVSLVHPRNCAEGSGLNDCD